MKRPPSLVAAVMICLVSAEILAEEPAAPPPPAAAAPAQNRPDRMELDPALIRGNQELPKVLYIVPWKDPGLADPAGRPLNSLVDEALSPVDRDVFRRQMRYFDQLYPAGDGGPAPQAQKTQD
jgi:hypothetical protein